MKILELTIASLMTASVLVAGPVENVKAKKVNGLELYRTANSNRVVLVNEGAGEAASIGTYSIRVMDLDGSDEPAELLAGVLRSRDGSIMAVWCGDLRGLGHDEVAVWLQSVGSGSYGELACFEIRGKKLVPVTIPSPGKGVKGYEGHDGFEIDAKGIRWSCPLYRGGDSNAEPHGGRARSRYDAKANQWIRDP